MDLPNEEVIFERVTFDQDAEYYLDESLTPVQFSRALTVRIDGEVREVKLSFSTSPSGARIPCIRLDGEKIFLDDDILEVASDCVRPA